MFNFLDQMEILTLFSTTVELLFIKTETSHAEVNLQTFIVVLVCVHVYNFI